jgi:16S rRNA processing protein RimM
MTSSQPSSSGAAENFAWLARIRKPQGRKGEVFADILTDFPEKFAERKRVWLIADPDFLRGKAAAAPREVTLENHWLHKGGIVFHFAGSGSISDAEALAGLVVAVPAEQRVPLAEDEVYIADLVGCVLVDVAGAAPVEVGPIEAVDRAAGPVALLVIGQPGSAEEILVPFAKSFLRRIDLEAKRVEMALPEGLLELNASGKTP